MSSKQNKCGECVGLVGLSNKRRYGGTMKHGSQMRSRPMRGYASFGSPDEPAKPKPLPAEPPLVPLKQRKKLLAKKQGHR